MLNIGVGIFAVRVNKVLVNGVSGIVVSFLFWQIGKWIKSQAKRKVILQKMSTLHYFTGMVCGMIANGLNNCIVYLGEERIAFFPIFVQTFIHVMIVSLCMLCIAFIFLHIFFVECKRECRRKEQYIESLKKYYKEQDGYVKEVRAIKHDIQAHMNVLCNYLELGKVEKALEYLRKMTEYEKLKDIKFYDVGNEVVNMILYESIARSNVCITVECLGNIPKELLLSDYDLCVIFSNLLSNSVEACEKLKIYDKKIRLEMKQYKNHFFIKIQNPIEWEIDVDKLSVISSKADKKCHGYGILNIKKIVKKYEGEIIFNKKDDIFEVEILFLEVVKDFILPS
ncbi:MAG: GHKL domain-containing protein [Lachnospiraceae bacterium]|nr:GHKL domain-containing protein [Lachnospiraceae bacterium]